MDINIGGIIRSVAVERRMKMKVLAGKMGMHAGSIGRVLGQANMQTEMVKKFCVVLDYDFFEHYSEELKLTKGMGKKTECENALVVSNEKVGVLEKEIVYLKEINELLRKRN